MADNLNALLIEVQELVGKLETIAFGGDDAIVVHNGVYRGSVQKEFKERFSQLQQMVNGRQAFATKSLMEADLAHNADVIALVWNDLVSENNGLYGKVGASGTGSWERSKYDIEFSVLSELRDVGSVLSSLSDEYISSRRNRSMHRDAVAGRPWSIVDKNGKVAFSINNDGSAEVQYLRSPFENTHRDIKYPWSVMDRDGRSAIAIDNDGNVEVGELIVRESSAGSRGSNDSFLWSIKDSHGSVSIGVRDDGKVFVNSDNLNVGISYIKPAIFSTNYAVSNVRKSPLGYVANRQDSEKFSYDVLNISGDLTDFSLVDSASPLLYMPFGGQSNAGQGGNSGVEFDATPYPHHCVTFANSKSAYGSAPAAVSYISGLGAVSDAASTAQFAATIASVSLEGMIRENSGEPSSGLMTHTCWYGGRPLADFVRGTDSWNNTVEIAKRSLDVVATYGRDVECKYYTFIQGETGSANYAAELLSYATDITNELANVFNSVPPLFVYLQINSADTTTVASGIEQEQLDVAATNANGRMVLAGPMYDAPLVDSIHQNAIGRMIIGERLAACYSALNNSQGFVPLSPLSIELVGNVIDISFNVPSAAIMFDADWVPSVPDFGFVFEDSDGSAVISDVSIIDGSSVRITLSSVPTGVNKKIMYAVLNDTTQNGWANGRGLLYSESIYKSQFFKRGYSLPEYVRHYCVRFTKEF